MSLPKLDSPTTEVFLPYSKKKIKIRPFTVKEEKLLLFAQNEKKMTAIVDAVKTVLKNCIVCGTNLETLPAFEVDYIFLKLRSLSVNNIVKLNIVDETKEVVEGETGYVEVELDLDDVNLDISKIPNDKIQISDKYWLKLKFPEYKENHDFSDEIFKENPANIAFELVSNAVDSVYSDDGDEVYLLKDYSPDERREFFDSLTTQNFKQIKEYIANIQQLTYDLHYVNAAGEEKTKTLSGLNDFFMYA